MSRSHFQQLGSILEQQLVQTGRIPIDTQRQRFINTLWSTMVDPAIAFNTHITAFNDDSLVVYASSSIWAHKLTHQKQTLLKNLDAAGINVSSLRIRTVPGTSADYNPARHVPKSTKLSPNGAKILRQFAASIKDEELARAIKRLSDCEQSDSEKSSKSLQECKFEEKDQ